VLSAVALTALLAVPPAARQPSESPSFLSRLWSIAGLVFDEDSRYYLQIGGITTGAGFSLGPGVRFRGLAGGLLDLDAVTVVSYRQYLLAEGSLTTTALGVSGLRAGVFARRKYFPQEDFFGVGLDSSLADRVSYTYDETAAGALVTFDTASPLTFDARLEYRRPDIGPGHDESFPSIEALFTDPSAPGLLRQPDFVVGSVSLTYEGATPAGHPGRGGRYQAAISRFSGRGANTYDFLRFDADLRQYVPVVRDRHLVVMRAVTALTNAPDGASVPFYYLPSLGGSSGLRGFHEFRFRDRNALMLQAEYRWLPARFVESAVFYDAGVAAPRRSGLTRDRMVSDYGVGLRFGTDSRVFFRVEAAFGSGEGTRVFAKFSGAF
jgi:outer membrane protein assembly factor BamA